MTTRREFIALLGGAAAWPLGARAQQGDRVRRVGALMPFAETDRGGRQAIQSFREGLTNLGWIEGRNLRIAASMWVGQGRMRRANAVMRAILLH
jgi:putative ABC transport system substrate-binding protein